MNRIISAAIILVVLRAGSPYAQTISDFFTPYGFKLPNLKAGQYLLSVRGDYEDLKYNRKTDHNYEIDRKTTLNSYASAAVVLAVTDRILLTTSLGYYPRRLASEQLRSTLFFATAKTTELQYGSLRPSLGLAFKPKPNLEIFGSFDYYYYEYDKRDYADYYDDNFEVRPFWERSRRVSIGVNWLGSL